MSDKHEALAKVIADAQNVPFPGVKQRNIAAAVVEFLTSDEAVTRADRAARGWFLLRPMPGDIGRAAILAAVGGSDD
ncbi:hypothetical protein GCM10022239_03640 [Leifsonia bigeumensis]|uniref:Uncharacterized protein n=1 Tax=Leifsonella bigeumensis TaxID=433643 RepID=A0ABP7F2P8_9MICO